jgi:phage baseplate assembly protein W
MHGYGPKLPLKTTPEDGKYGLTKSINENVAQNIKNLVLTCPGERIMDPVFGVGLKNYLFEINSVDTAERIASNITKQAGLYMPNININNVDFKMPQDSDKAERSPDYYTTSEIDSNLLGITITYSIRGGGNMVRKVFVPAVGNSAPRSGY